MCFHPRIKWVKRAGSGMNSTHTQHIRLKKTPRLCVSHFTTHLTCSICGCKCPYTAFIQFDVIFLLQSSQLASAFSSFYIFSLISLPFTAAGARMSRFCLSHTLFQALTLTSPLTQLELVPNPGSWEQRPERFMLAHKNPRWHECHKPWALACPQLI